MAPLVSLCIRGWRAATLPRAIESALRQTLTELEVVVTDDRGDLEDVALGFGDPRVRYHRNPERLGPAWNAREALQRARGRFIGLLNDDDWLLPEFAEAAVERFAAVPEAGLVFTNHFLARGGRRVERPAPVADGTYTDLLPRLIRTKPSVVSAALMRREVWIDGEQAMPIPQGTVPDSFIYLRAAQAGVVFSYVDRPLSVWEFGHDNLTAQPIVRDMNVALWSAFAFADPEAERLRLEELAGAHLSRAADRLQRGQISTARDDLQAANKLGRGSRTLTMLSRVPQLIAPAAALKRLAVRARTRPLG